MHRDGGRTLNYDIFYLILRPHTTNYEQNYVIIEPLTLIDGGQTLILGWKDGKSSKFRVLSSKFKRQRAKIWEYKSPLSRGVPHFVRGRCFFFWRQGCEQLG
jgi:hypothetical protein